MSVTEYRHQRLRGKRGTVTRSSSPSGTSQAGQSGCPPSCTWPRQAPTPVALSRAPQPGGLRTAPGLLWARKPFPPPSTIPPPSGRIRPGTECPADRACAGKTQAPGDTGTQRPELGSRPAPRQREGTPSTGHAQMQTPGRGAGLRAKSALSLADSPPTPPPPRPQGAGDPDAVRGASVPRGCTSPGFKSPLIRTQRQGSQAGRGPSTQRPQTRAANPNARCPVGSVSSNNRSFVLQRARRTIR